MMFDNMNLNMAQKGKKEILNKLSDKQISILTKRLLDDALRTGKKEDYERLTENRDYFIEKDVYSAYYCLKGAYECVTGKLIATEIEKETITKKDILLDTFNKMDIFKMKVDLLKNLISISKGTNDTKSQEKINSLIENIYFDISLEYKPHYIFINGLKESQENIINNHEANKKLLKENPQLEVDKKLIETYETYIDVLNVCIDNYDKTFKEFEEIKEKIET